MNKDLSSEFIYKASLSSGAGGQHVNKVNTKVELRFHIFNSKILSESEKEILINKLSKKINKEGYIVLSTQTERSQLLNKEKVTDKCYKLIHKALIPKKQRRTTKPTAHSIEKRLEEKKKISEKKQLRKKM